jgi:hypothetical protein
MDLKWYYKHAGHVFGPFAADEMHRLAALGLLEPEDRLWPEGGSRKESQAARSAIDFDSLPRPKLESPDWLADVERAEHRAAEAKRPAPGVPDWLADVRQFNEVQPAQAEPPVETAPAVEPTSGAGSAASEASPVIEPSGTDEESPSAAQTPAAATDSPAVPTARACTDRSESLAEVYRRAQSAVHAWADMDVNKPLILAGDPKALRRDVAIQVILQMVERCGPEVVIRLWDHLEFIVDNRRKYYLATG